MISSKSVAIVASIGFAILTRASARATDAGLVSGVTASDSAHVKDTTATDRLKLSGTFQGELRWSSRLRYPQPDNRAFSDLYVRLVEIALESPLSENVSSTVVLNSEWLDDFAAVGDQKVAIDEVHMDFQGTGAGAYIVLGKRSQPFGVFENHLISDPIARNAYEVNKVGLTTGYQTGSLLDVSLTVYKGAESMDHLFQSQLFDTAVVRRVPDTVTQIGSWIALGSFATTDSSLTLVGAVLSEPGHVRRNVSLQLAANVLVPMAKSVSVDAEYIKALHREIYLGADREFRESVIGVTLAYSFVYRPSHFLRRGLYRARRSFTRSHPFTTALRYESFLDDGMASHFLSRTTTSRYSIAGRYTVVEKAGTIAYVAVELNRTNFDGPTVDGRRESDHSDTFLARFGVDF